MISFASARRALRTLAALFALAVFAAGCAGGARLPRTFYDADGTPVMHRRVEKHPAVDYWHRWRSKAYDRVEKALKPAKLSEEQRAVVEEHGRPEYRRGFESMFGEDVLEWVFLEENFMAQFVAGRLVYADTVGDYEQMLIMRGYPDRVIHVKQEEGARIQTHVYLDAIWSGMSTYTYSDGVLVNKVE